MYVGSCWFGEVWVYDCLLGEVDRCRLGFSGNVDVCVLRVGLLVREVCGVVGNVCTWVTGFMKCVRWVFSLPEVCRRVIRFVNYMCACLEMCVCVGLVSQVCV